MLSLGALNMMFRTLQQRRTAVPMAIVFGLGVLAEAWLPIRPGSWLIIGSVIALFAAALNRWSIASVLLLVALFFSGLTAAQIETFCFSRHDIAQFTSDASRMAQLELYVDAAPRMQSEAGLARPLPPREVGHATVRRVLTRDGWENAAGQIQFTLDEPHPELAVGQTIRV